MKGDFTRWTFQPTKNYSSVLLQQSRVLLDSDWNEQREIDLAARRQLAADLIGEAAGPLGDLGYVVEAVDEEPAGGDGVFEGLVLRPGRYYVDGILCELHQRTPISAQPALPGFDPLAGLPEGRYLVYLDVWERHVSHVEDADIKEKALGGPDHTTRRQVVAQARLLELDALELGDGECDVIHSPEALAEILEGTRGSMAASVDPAPPDLDPCVVPADAGYRGLENQLYRVEIHRGGDDGSVTFKWSRDNGSVVTAWTGHPNPAGEQKLLELADLGPDGERTFNESGVLVELLDDTHQLLPGPGLLARVASADEAARTLTLGEVLDAGGQVVVEPLPADTIVRGADAHHPRVRRWEGGGVRRIDDVNADGWIELEQGVRVRFDLTAGRTFRSGDFWLIPARTVDGSIEWDPADFQQPHGVEHRHACLAVVERDATGWHVESPCQDAFPSADSLVQLHYVGGDGQQAVLSDPAHVLPAPLRVQVLNGGVPVEGARLSFSIVTPPVGDGSLRDLVAGAVGPQIQAVTGSNGVARVEWTLASESAWDAEHGLIDQRVRVVLLDECEEETSQRVVFSVHESQAVEVRYDNTVCAPMAALQGVGFDTDNAQAALDVLCENPHLSYVGGDGQEAMPGEELPNDLVVRVGNGAFDQSGVEVRFLLVDLATGEPPSEESWAGSLDDVQTGSTVDADWPSTTHRRITVPTDADGYARVRWRLGDTPGPQRPGVVARVVHPNAPMPFDVFGPGAEVRFAGRWSRASEVHYTPACAHLQEAGVDTVQEALDALCSDRTLYYVGGTGQPINLGETLPVPLTVRVANEGVPTEGARVRFRIVNLSDSGGVDESTGGTLGAGGPGVVAADNWGAGGTRSVIVQTDADGRARATWIYGVVEGSGVPGVRAVLLDDASAPTPSRLDFEAVLQRPTLEQDDGVHVVGTTMIERGGIIRDLLNDSTVDPYHLLHGIEIHCDREPELRSLRGKRTAHLSVEVPYGWHPDRQHEVEDRYFAAEGVQHYDTHLLEGTVRVVDNTIRWVPSTAARLMLVSSSSGPFARRVAGSSPLVVAALGNPVDWPLPLRLSLYGGGATRVRANLAIEGDFVVAREDSRLHVDGETLGVPDTATARIDLQFPSGNGRRGGDFRSWFWLDVRVWAPAEPGNTGEQPPIFSSHIALGVTPQGGVDDRPKSDVVVAWSGEGAVHTLWHDSDTNTWIDDFRHYGDDESVAAEKPELWLRSSGGQPDGYALAFRDRAGVPSVVRVNAAREDEPRRVLPRGLPRAALPPRGVELGRGDAIAWTGTDGSLVAALYDGDGTWKATNLGDELGDSSVRAILHALEMVHPDVDPGTDADGPASTRRSSLLPLEVRRVKEAVAAGRGREIVSAMALRLGRENGFTAEETEAFRTVAEKLGGPGGGQLTRLAWRDELHKALGETKLPFLGELAVLADPDGTVHVLGLARHSQSRTLYWFSQDSRGERWKGRDLTPELNGWRAPHRDRLAAAFGSDRSGQAVRVVAWVASDGAPLALLKVGSGDWSLEPIQTSVELDSERRVAAAVDGEGVVHVLAASKDGEQIVDVWRDHRTPWTTTDLSARASLDGDLTGLLAACSADRRHLVVAGHRFARGVATLRRAAFGLPEFRLPGSGR